MFHKFFINFFWVYIKMSEINDLTYYQHNQTVTLNKAKDYHKNNKERLKEQARDKYRSLSEEEKNKRREYGKDRYRNMCEEILQKAKEKYSEVKAAEYYLEIKESLKEKSKKRYKILWQEEKDKIKEYQEKGTKNWFTRKRKR